ncbi:MAG: HipA domain-containing protein [Phycisphaerales bacterium]|nr:HipA domain-containing protein [Phycisphaerales bacterium]
MTSDYGATECYVYVAPPGETDFVTAGKFALATDRRGVASGKFVYGRSYLARANAVPLDPLELKLGTKTHETRLLKGMFGALRDASPDYWGRRVIEKHSGKTELGEIDYLLYSPDDRAGALGFGLNAEPPAPRRTFNRTMDLARLQALADAIVAEEELPQTKDATQVQDLLLVGTSMGGARPKAVVEDEDALWIAKFNRADDKWNHARVEHAMLVFARECGVQSAESRLVTIGDRDVVMIKRFDRDKTASGYRRARMLSALTLLRAGDTHQDRDRWSYVLLAEELRRISAQPKIDAPELFRRMCFNALISNIDDHPRNHAVIAMDTDWKLSPAYDLTPATPISIERRDLAMACGDMGRYAHADNLLSQSARFLLAPEEARRTVEKMEEAIRDRWYEVARREGVSEADCEKLKTAFAYEGFRLATAAAS